eukprot:188509_1
MISLKSIIAPSVLSSDFAHLAAESQKMKDYGCEWLHLDIIDGHFAPNITFGPPVIKSLRPYSDLFFDCHCMVSDPKRWILDLKKAGVDQVNFHIEATGIENAADVIDSIVAAGMKAAISLKPKTDLDDALMLLIESRIDDIHMILIMSVEPGFSGQKFMPEVLPKISRLRARFPALNIQIDGGINAETVEAAARAGANVIVAGSGIFRAEIPEKAVKVLRGAVEIVLQE